MPAGLVTEAWNILLVYAGELCCKMRFKVKLLSVESGGKHVVTLSKEDSDELGIKSSGRVKIQNNGKVITAIVNIVTKTVPKGIIGVYNEVKNYLGLKENAIVEVDVAN